MLNAQVPGTPTPAPDHRPTDILVLSTGFQMTHK